MGLEIDSSKVKMYKQLKNKAFSSSKRKKNYYYDKFVSKVEEIHYLCVPCYMLGETEKSNAPGEIQ